MLACMSMMIPTLHEERDRRERERETESEKEKQKERVCTASKCLAGLGGKETKQEQALDGHG